MGGRTYSWRMTAIDEAAALVALLRTRSHKVSWNETAVEVAFFGSAVAVWEQLEDGEGSLIADPRLIEVLTDARQEVESWHAVGLRFVTVLDHEYPRRLLDIRETPPFLFAAGELRSDDLGMSVVGSREASVRGLEIAAAAARILVERGLSVISGLAAGIDTAAHQAALDEGGRTVAFLGTGIAKSYPAENARLQARIAEQGLVLSQFWPDAPPTKHTFPMRNASMSGYGLATIVVEAGEYSGARIQARKAVEHGRPVVLTDMVTSRTKWGAALVGQPGVHVARGVEELGRIVDQIVADQDVFERVLRELADSLPA